jgi:hypothetical protein
VAPIPDEVEYGPREGGSRQPTQETGMQVNLGGQGGRSLLSTCGTALLFLVVFGGVGIGLGIWGWNVLTDARASESWPTTEGQVISSEVDHSSDAEGGDSYQPQISYRYEVDDQTYEADRIRFGQNSYSSSRQAEAEANRYPVGRQVEVFYEPGRPENAVLEPGASMGSYLGLGLGGTFLTIGLITPALVMLAYLLRRR